MVAVMLEKKVAIVVKVRYRVVARSSSSAAKEGRADSGPERYEPRVTTSLQSALALFRELPELLVHVRARLGKLRNVSEECLKFRFHVRVCTCIKK